MTAGPQHAIRNASDIERPRRSGRHHRPGGGRWKVAVAVAAVVAAATAGIVVATRSAGDPDVRAAGSPSATAPVVTTTATGASSSPSGAPAPAGGSAAAAPVTGCPVGGDPLTIAAAPAFAAFLESHLGAEVEGCPTRVLAQDPADFVAAATAVDGNPLPDVWIPDSSIWVERARAAGVPVPAGQPPVLARSAVVLALSPTAAGRLPVGTPDLRRILDTRTTAAPIRVGLPDPERSVPADGVLLALAALDTTVPADRAALTWGARSGPAGLPTGDDRLLAGLDADPDTAVPVSEQSLWTYNRTAAAPATAVYGVSAGLSVDYPLVVFGDRPATALLAELQSGSMRQALLDNGFRDGAGVAGGSLGESGVAPIGTDVPSPAAVDDAVQTLRTLSESTRMLAVIDVSGSMAQAVPGAGGATRLDLAKAAASRGLGLYPADSEVGLWTFSRNLTADSDHRELVPVAPLGAAADGVTGKQRVADAIDAVEVLPDGDTGLYDTTLDAVRTMRSNWDPARVNVVLILSDGQNDDPGSISLPDLVNTLTAEADPTRPVAVVTIAFGPDSDVAAMNEISRATGGATYVAVDPRDIIDIFLDSVGRRVCRPGC